MTLISEALPTTKSIAKSGADITQYQQLFRQSSLVIRATQSYSATNVIFNNKIKINFGTGVTEC
jgi:hypothetical protein